MRHFSLLESLLRFLMAWLIFAPTCTLVLLVTPFLLPWRRPRTKIALWAMGAIGPWMIRALGVPTTHPDRAVFAQHAPALFVLNHTSSLDTFYLSMLLPPGTTAVSKKETLFIPFFGLAFWLCGNLLLDRKSPERAHRSVARLNEVIRAHNLGLMFSPEGTRSPDGRLRPFKKGFVHIAVATGLPIVPLVIEGAHIAWPRASLRLCDHPVTIRLLDPIDTTGWSLDTIDQHVAQVRQAYLDTLPPDQLPAPLPGGSGTAD